MRKITVIIWVLIIISISVSVYGNTPSNWAQAQVETAERLGIAYPKGAVLYDKVLTRGELAYVAVNLNRLLNPGKMSLNDDNRTTIASSYTDAYTNGSLFSDEIMLAIKYELMNGTTANTFSEKAIVTREQTATVLYRIAKEAGILNASSAADLSAFKDYSAISSYAYEPFSVMVSEKIISGTSINTLSPGNSCTYEEVLAIAVRFWDLATGKQNTAAVDETELYDTSKMEYYSFEWEMSTFEGLYNARKIPVKRYRSNEEALLDMESVTVNVWSLKSNGEKVPTTKTFLVHKDVAEDVIGIFDEIFSGEERFPIQSVGGYSWRGLGSTSSHINGLAIDINPNQNYFVDTRGNTLSGSHWLPGEDPYSIPPDGDVIRAFENKGWFWGGYGWSTTGYDYMHFSYTGV